MPKRKWEMLDKIKSKIGEIKIPETNATLASENRIVEVEFKGENLNIVYDRAQISPGNKRKIEDEIYASLNDLVPSDKVFITTKSVSANEVYASIGSEAPKVAKNPAELKVGHGQIGQKKRIEGVKTILAVASGKGGVGKSTFTTNLAMTLVNQGKKVGVIDADIYGPSIPMMLGKRSVRPDATEDKKIIPLESFGLKFISFGNFINEDEPVVWRGPMLGGVLNQFFFETDWGELDYLILDLPPGTGDVQLSMVQNVEVDGSIIISTPQDVALLDAKKGLLMFHKLNVPVIGMVENMSSFICDGCDKEHYIFGTGGVTSACNELGVGFLGKIPLEMALRKSADFGKPYMAQNQYEGRKIWEAFNDIALRVERYFNPSETKKGFFKNLFKK